MNMVWNPSRFRKGADYRKMRPGQWPGVPVPVITEPLHTHSLVHMALAAILLVMMDYFLY